MKSEGLGLSVRTTTSWLHAVLLFLFLAFLVSFLLSVASLLLMPLAALFLCLSGVVDPVGALSPLLLTLRG